MSRSLESPEIPLVGQTSKFRKYGIDGPACGDEDESSEPIKTVVAAAAEENNKAPNVRQSSSASASETARTIFEHVGARLARRKELFSRRKWIADCSFVFAIIGIIIMIVETELEISEEFGQQGKEHIASRLLKSSISLTTIILLGFIIWYHKLDIQVFMIDNSMEDWRLAMSVSRLFRIFLELVICAIHPIPLQHQVYISSRGTAGSHRARYNSIDFLLSLPMFLRFYLLCRSLMLHSRLYQDASAQSLGALNRIHFNFRFIFKSVMNMYPEYMLTIMITFLFLWASWAFRVCEREQGPSHSNFFNSMWLIAITFLSVGYGDIVPVTDCGRMVAVFTGIFGAGCTALVVAVLARKLELSRAEKYVHNFVIDVELDKQVKHAAANVLKEGWLVYKAKKADQRTRALRHQRRLLQAIRRIRELKNDQRRLVDNAVTMVEMYKNQTYMYNMIQTVTTRTKDMENQIQEINSKLNLLLTRSR